MRSAIDGSLAGLAATVPMTLAMEGMHRQLPRREQYKLPPRQITMRMAEFAGIEDDLDEPERKTATLLSHFGYGAATGAIYGAVGQRLLPGPAGGVAFGLAVWAASYLGWLPAANILPPATRTPARRNALMIAAHLVWGLTLGAATEKLQAR
jgi:hypothetical protein